MEVGSASESLDIAIVHDASGLPADAGRSVCLSVGVSMDGFAARSVGWICREDWGAFLAAVASLQQDRRGEARLQTISDEIALHFVAVGTDGEARVSGVMAHPAKFTPRLEFRDLWIGTSMLADLLEELRLETL